MKKLKISKAVSLTFEEGFNKNFENCRQRNLRDLQPPCIFTTKPTVD